MYFTPRSRAARLIALSRIALPTLLTGATTAAFAQTHAATAAPAPLRPKISAKQAEAAAVRKIPGKVVSSQYEFEDGHWQYAVVVTAKKGQMYEVAVSSMTGKVTDTEKTSMSEEVREEAADKKKAMAPVKATKRMVGGDKEKDDEKDEKDEKGSK